MIVVTLIGLLAAMAIPNFIRSREAAQLTSIFNNLRIIEGAKDQWAVETKKGTGDTPDWPALAAYMKGGTITPAASETYTFNLLGSPAFATSYCEAWHLYCGHSDHGSIIGGVGVAARNSVSPSPSRPVPDHAFLCLVAGAGTVGPQLMVTIVVMSLGMGFLEHRRGPGVLRSCPIQCRLRGKFASASQPSADFRK